MAGIYYIYSMTRINAGIHPSELCDRHLLAEHREIKRIPNMVKSGKAKLSGIPTEFTLGQGHVRFFYDKIGYLKRRYLEIRRECISRGFRVADYGGSFEGIEPGLMNDWHPGEREREMIRKRIDERLGKMGVTYRVW